jgi:hypothetical protein
MKAFDNQDQFDSEMAFVPKHKFFPTIQAWRDSMVKRMAFLKVLDKSATASGVFLVTDSFAADFLERND